MRIEDLADRFYVSRTAMGRLIKAVKEDLARFSLELKSRPKYGIMVEGTEKNKRLCYAHALTDSMEDTYSEQKMQALQFPLQRLSVYRVFLIVLSCAERLL